MRHAYVKMEKSGAVSIRWWVDTAAGVACRTLIQVHPGESAFGVAFGEWCRRGGTFVNLDELDPEGPGSVGLSN